MPIISIIVALDNNRAIGLNNNLLWHISDDLKRFKALTTGHTVIMGRRTFDSLPKRPLPNRRNIVLTHNPSFQYEGVDVVQSVQQCLELISSYPSDDEVFIIGGSSIYEAFLPFAQRIYATHVHHSFQADAFFPQIDSDIFLVQEQTPLTVDEKSNLTYNYTTYIRKND